MAHGERYSREILEQPQVLARLLHEQRASIETIARELKRVHPTYGLLAARGSSDNAARYAQYLLGIQNQLTCALATPSVFTAYASPPNLQGSLTIGLSQSGQSPDIVRVITAAQEQGAMTLAITNDVNSPLAQTSKWVVALGAGIESAVPATKTYTAELMAIAMLSAALQMDEAVWTILATIPAAVQATIELNAQIEGVESLKNMEHLVVLGRGYNYASAFEIALKINETSSVLALPFSFADFFHGPIATLGPDTQIMLIAPRGVFDTQIATLLEAIERSHAQLIVISDDRQLLDRATVALKIPDTPEWISPVCAAVAGQLFSLALALAKVQDPDQPRGLKKITLTY